MAAAHRVRRATANESAVSLFRQTDARREALIKAISAGGKRALLRLALEPHEREPVKAYVDMLPTGKQAATILNGMRRFGMRAAQEAGLPPLRLPTQAITTSFKAEILDGIHLAADTYKIALYVAASTIGASTTAYTATNEVANGNGYTTGGVTLAGRQVVADGTTQILDWTTDPSWAAATITARGAMIYNSTRSNKSVLVLDFGADISSTNGTFTVAFPAPTAAAGLLRIA